jgi:hypothetical protein
MIVVRSERPSAAASRMTCLPPMSRSFIQPTGQSHASILALARSNAPSVSRCSSAPTPRSQPPCALRPIWLPGACAAMSHTGPIPSCLALCPIGWTLSAADVLEVVEKSSNRSTRCGRRVEAPGPWRSPGHPWPEGRSPLPEATRTFRDADACAAALAAGCAKPWLPRGVRGKAVGVPVPLALCLACVQGTHRRSNSLRACSFECSVPAGLPRCIAAAAPAH